MQTWLRPSKKRKNPEPAGGQCPQPISHGSFQRIVTSLTRPVSLLRCSRCLGQSPPCQRGVPRHRRGGGIPQAGRVPHGFVLSESACCNPSVTATPCQLPFAREPWGAVENKGPVVLLAAVVKPRLFRCKPRLRETPRQDFPAGVCFSCFCCFFRRVQRRTGKTGTESGTGRGYSAPDSRGRKGLQATATERRGIPRGWSC